MFNLIDKRVLVVEDDPTLLAFWDRIFRKLGVSERVLLTSSVQAKNLICRSRFDLLISDIIMGDINGYQLARIAQELCSGIKIILTTGYNTDLSRFDLKGLNIHLLHKPYCDIEGLFKMVSHLLNDEDVFEDADEDSWSDNEDYPDVTEWKL